MSGCISRPALIHKITPETGLILTRLRFTNLRILTICRSGLRCMSVGVVDFTNPSRVETCIQLAPAACRPGGGCVSELQARRLAWSTVIQASAPSSPPPSGPGPPIDSRISRADDANAGCRRRQVGLDTYDLIRTFGGPNPIEAPDLYPINHPDVRHIYEDFDRGRRQSFRVSSFTATSTSIVTVSISRSAAQRDQDLHQLGRGGKGLRERDVHLHAGSSGSTRSMEVSTRFTHFFQLKAVGGETATRF